MIMIMIIIIVIIIIIIFQHNLSMVVGLKAFRFW